MFFNSSIFLRSSTFESVRLSGFSTQIEGELLDPRPENMRAKIIKFTLGHLQSCGFTLSWRLPLTWLGDSHHYHHQILQQVLEPLKHVVMQKHGYSKQIPYMQVIVIACLRGLYAIYHMSPRAKVINHILPEVKACYNYFTAVW